MKRYVHAFAMCQTMFCAIPVPGGLWDEEARDKMLLFLPVLGLELGIFWALLGWIAELMELPALIRGLILGAYPYLVTGNIHLDGFMDVTDAVGSCRTLERRREILKDPHVGSFAVIGLGMLLMAQLAFAASWKPGTNPLGLCLIPVVSRCGSALALTALPPMSTSQYAGQKRPRGRLWVFSGMLVLALAAGFFCFGKYGFSLLAGILGYGLALWKGYRSLEGMNGDIAGYALTISELCALGAYVLI